VGKKRRKGKGNHGSMEAENQANRRGNLKRRRNSRKGSVVRDNSACDRIMCCGAVLCGMWEVVKEWKT